MGTIALPPRPPPHKLMGKIAMPPKTPDARATMGEVTVEMGY